MTSCNVWKQSKAKQNQIKQRNKNKNKDRKNAIIFNLFSQLITAKEVVDVCDPNPCKNGGVCVQCSSTTHGYYCDCPSEKYLGENCAIVEQGKYKYANFDCTHAYFRSKYMNICFILCNSLCHKIKFTPPWLPFKGDLTSSLKFISLVWIIYFDKGCKTYDH